MTEKVKLILVTDPALLSGRKTIKQQGTEMALTCFIPTANVTVCLQAALFQKQFQVIVTVTSSGFGTDLLTEVHIPQTQQTRGGQTVNGHRFWFLFFPMTHMTSA